MGGHDRKNLVDGDGDVQDRGKKRTNEGVSNEWKPFRAVAGVTV